ncbi:immune inhibitor A [Kibdelosporangium philippinense]|uniref:Immune inhibitor A n=1 Tax=Kibdelosporangium philippinense TaxID=211113 RepID=A0ABS8ZEN7_9PSEU|nr:immune inhibitor A domain-containing protein [Kibdelosporangium philippinense]MCE7005917.1 immune inhibitor A [Kibdelosporangium philippinense]
MHRRSSTGLALLALVGMGVGVLSAPAAAAPSVTNPGIEYGAPDDHDLPNKYEEKRRALRKEALAEVLSGQAKVEKRGASTVARIGDKPADAARGGQPNQRVDQYVELGREKTDNVFVVLAEFGNKRDPRYPDVDIAPAIPGPTKFDGPLHNEIPAPNRAVDNSTVWQPDYSREHFQQMYFGQGPGVESLKTFYEKQSSGRYSVDGMVTDWVKVDYNEARYGRSNGFPCAGNICNNTWDLIRDSVNRWVENRVAAGATVEQIREELKPYDTWDRYDHDSDGDFNEADGYLDHFQIVHSGGDQADGDPIQGEDAIWSHRWYTYPSSPDGPPNNKRGGTQIGATGLWVGDYTIQPENGGLGVFAHEYGHDLGLPDHYDTAGPGGAQENGVNWWSLMGQSRVSAAGEPAIGTRANDLSAWDKLQLGWLDYEVVVAGQDRRIDLGPHEYNSDKAQGVVVVLPDKQVSDDYGKPFAGTRMYWSGKGDDVDNSMVRDLDLTGKTSASLTLKSRYDIEEDFDYLYVQASVDGGATWTSLDGTVNGAAFPKDGGNAPALTGAQPDWVDVNVPLDSLAGKQAKLRFRYVTDGGVAPNGFFADDIKITADGTVVVNDGAEGTPAGWTLNGFKQTTGTETAAFDHFYIATNRTYSSFDQYMKTGPYNFGFPDRPDFVEHFPYQDGLLVSYWDTSWLDNNTSAHPGAGLILPVDANPEPIYNLQGQPWRPRIAGYDAPFSLQKSDSITLHAAGRASYIRGKAAQPLFDDTRSYWSADQPTAGVKLPASGVKIRVLSQQGTSMTVRVFK